MLEYALRRESPVYHRWLVRGQRISAMTAICNGLVAYELTSYRNCQWAAFLQVSPFPQVAPFELCSEWSVIDKYILLRLSHIHEVSVSCITTECMCNYLVRSLSGLYCSLRQWHKKMFLNRGAKIYSARSAQKIYPNAFKPHPFCANLAIKWILIYKIS